MDRNLNKLQTAGRVDVQNGERNMKSSIMKLSAFALVAAHLLVCTTGCDPSDSSARPRLVVVIVVDQFRYDFLERFKGAFGTTGFKRLMNEGAVFENANYDYAPTHTAPGHASIFTGSVPAQNGVVGNSWYDRESGTQRVMVSDDAAKLVTSYGTQSYTKLTRPASPRILIGSTFGDQMRLATEFRSKVVALSLKDRAAVLPGGKEANGAYWFDASSGTLVSSDYYFSSMPAWVDRFNGERKVESYFGKVWDRALGPSFYELTQSVVTDVKGSPIGRHFPYTITGGEERLEKSSIRLFNTLHLLPNTSLILPRRHRRRVAGIRQVSRPVGHKLFDARPYRPRLRARQRRG